MAVLNAYSTGNTMLSKAILRDLINATIGFEELAPAIKRPSKSLPRMPAPGWNQNTGTCFDIVSALQKKTYITLPVSAKASREERTAVGLRFRSV